MCDQQRLRPACAYAQTDQSLGLLLEYSVTVKLLTKQTFEFLSLTRGCTGSSESTLVKMPHFWKSRVTAQMEIFAIILFSGPFPIGPAGFDNMIFKELYSLFLKFSALGLLQDIRNNYHS